ncbi:MAG: hypothetical protein H0X37_05295 [Herpetosiphonaceae bacterium]|nr:hypothetical protein [Herpetosiphonaceae bacterium]
MTTRTLSRRLVPVLLAALSLMLYLLTLTGVHTFDALSYIRDVNGRSGFFFHPHHLLYSPTGWAFWQLWRGVGYAGDAAKPLAVLNAIAGTVCGWGLYRLLLRLTGDTWAAVVATGLLLFNYGVWFYSVETDVYLLVLVWLVLALTLIVELLTVPRRRTVWALGVVVGMAALYHQANALLGLIVALAIVIAPQPSRGQKLRQFLLVTALAVGIVALGYGIAALDFYHFRSLAAIHDWMLFYVETGWWGQTTRGRWTDLAAGLGTSISPEVAWPFWVGIIAILLTGLPTAARRWPRIVAIAALWVIIYGAFFSWWEGTTIKYWIGSLMPLWFLVGLSIAGLRPLPIRRVGTVLGVLGVALLAWHNWTVLQPQIDPALDLQRQFSASIRTHSARDDLILSPGGIMELYLPYYEDRHNVQTLTQMMLTTHDDGAAALGLLHEQIARALQAGYGVIMDDALFHLPPELDHRYRLPQAQLDTFWQPYHAALVPVVQDKGSTYFWRLPSANERALGAGWSWDSFDWGWQAANVSNIAYTAGICFEPQSDPNMLSPVVSLDASAFHGVAVTMQTTMAHQTAQLFYAGNTGAMDDAHSVQWTLKNDGQSHTYTIKLSSTHGWNGTITRLRLDPVTVGDGTPATHTCVSQLHMLP